MEEEDLGQTDRRRNEVKEGYRHKCKKAVPGLGEKGAHESYEELGKDFQVLNLRRTHLE